MPPNPISPIRKAWYRWKTLNLPWRKRFLVGFDLQGNTFWEFRDTLSSHQSRMRRIAQYPPSTHLSEVNINPQWHQWLRHTRHDPPSLREQSQDLIRQENLKILAAQADARWAAKRSVLDATEERGKHSAALEGKIPVEYAEVAEAQNQHGEMSSIDVGSKDRVPGESSAVGETSDAGAESTGQMRAPDGIRHQFVRGFGHDKNTLEKGKKEKQDPWKQARGGPSETWQPESWGSVATPRQ